MSQGKIFFLNKMFQISTSVQKEEDKQKNHFICILKWFHKMSQGKMSQGKMP